MKREHDVAHAHPVRTLRWTILAGGLALGGPASAQTQPLTPAQGPLTAFVDAFDIVRKSHIDPVSPKTLILRAVHGLATSPALATQDQQRLIASAENKIGKAGADDVLPLLRGFGDLLDALHATAETPAQDALLRTAMAGMLDALDGQAQFLPPGTQAGPGAEAGAGLMLTASPDGPRVIRAFAHGPAADAGVQRGDGLLAINGQPTTGLSLDAVKTLLQGTVGSSVTLLIRHAGTPDAVTLRLTRAVIRTPLITARAIGPVAYLRLEAFPPGAAKALHQAFIELQSRITSPMRGVVLDLRGNSGGRLTEAVAVADELLPPATPIAAIVGRQASDNQRFTAAAGDMTARLPMVVLVNETTGAGSEIVTAAVQTGRGAVVMGSHTAGSGQVATVIPIPPLGTMRLTTQRIMLATGEPLKPPGVLPQVALVERQTGGSHAPTLETAGSDPTIMRLRRGIPQTPQAGETFEDLDVPGADFELRQACAALAMLSPDSSSHP